MKSKIILSIIPISAFVSLISGGLAAFSFGGSGDSSILSTTVSVTDVSSNSYGKFYLSSDNDSSHDLKLILDQEASSSYTSTNGPYFDGDLSFILDPNSNNDSIKATEYYEYTFTFAFKLNDSDLSEYLNIYCEDYSKKEEDESNNATSIITNNSSYTIYDHYYVSGSKALSNSETNLNVTIKDKLSCLFIEGKKPENIDDYNTMIEKLVNTNQIELSISFNVNIIQFTTYSTIDKSKSYNHTSYGD